MIKVTATVEKEFETASEAMAFLASLRPGKRGPSPMLSPAAAARELPPTDGEKKTCKVDGCGTKLRANSKRCDECNEDVCAAHKKLGGGCELCESRT